MRFFPGDHVVHPNRCIGVLVGTRLDGQDCQRRNQPGPYQIQAAINAVHSDAATANETDWGQILQLYNQLMAGWPSPIVALNRAVAVAEVEGCDAALRIVDDLALQSYYLFHAVRADLLRRVSRHRDAIDAYDEAISRCANSAERRFLTQRKNSLPTRVE